MTVVVVVSVAAGVHGRGIAAHSHPEGLIPRVLVCVLLAVVHLLLERLRLLLVAEG